jgi:hypothetical protein
MGSNLFVYVFVHCITQKGDNKIINESIFDMLCLQKKIKLIKLIKYLTFCFVGYVSVA